MYPTAAASAIPNRLNFTTPASFHGLLNKQINLRREPPRPPNEYCVPGGRRWAHTGAFLGDERGWTRAQLAVFNEVNRAIQLKQYKGKITIRQLCYYTGLKERAVYYALRFLKDKKIIYAITPPGRTSTYYLEKPYAAPRSSGPLHGHADPLINKGTETTTKPQPLSLQCETVENVEDAVRKAVGKTVFGKGFS